MVVMAVKPHSAHLGVFASSSQRNLLMKRMRMSAAAGFSTRLGQVRWEDPRISWRREYLSWSALCPLKIERHGKAAR